MARVRVVSWLRAASLTFPAMLLPVVLRVRVVPDTVAGPHRHVTGFRGSDPRNQLYRSLRPPKRAGKRKNHRRADDECQRDHVARIDLPILAG